MSIAGPFICLDYDAEPTVTTVEGREVVTYPPLAGVFYITDLATFARSADVLTAWQVEPAQPQFVLAGAETVTLQFADEAEAAPVVGPVNALPPVAPQPPAAPAEAEARRLIRKSLVQERVNAIGKLETVFAVLLSQPLMFVRWLAPDWPNVYADDEGLLTILAAVDCTPEQIAFVTAP